MVKKQSKVPERELARKQLGFITETTMHGPFLHEMMRPDDDMSFMMMRHMPDIIDRFLSRIELPRTRLVKSGHVKGIEMEATGTVSQKGKKGQQ